MNLGWYMIAGWGKIGGYKMKLVRPAGWSDDEWDQFCREVEQDFRELARMDTQEDWAYGPDPSGQ